MNGRHLASLEIMRKPCDLPNTQQMLTQKSHDPKPYIPLLWEHLRTSWKLSTQLAGPAAQALIRALNVALSGDRCDSWKGGKSRCLRAQITLGLGHRAYLGLGFEIPYSMIVQPILPSEPMLSPHNLYYPYIIFYL